VDRGLEYFVARDAKADPLSLLFLDYLRRKHDLKPLEPVVAHLKNAKADPSHPDPQLMLHVKTYARLADVAAAPSADELSAVSHELDVMALEALYCDRGELKPGLIDRLRKTASPGKYYLTHAALYTGWALENGCLKEDAARTLIDELAPRLDALIRAEGGATDLAMEAISVLFFVGRRNDVRPEWVEQVKAAQKKNGGWSHDPRAEPTNDHSSLLGFWVVIEAARPNAPPRTWLR
jgi:hypothetical protein